MPHLTEGASWIEMSTISKEDIARFAEFTKKYNVGEVQSTQVMKLLEGALNTNLRADGYPPTLT